VQVARSSLRAQVCYAGSNPAGDATLLTSAPDDRLTYPCGETRQDRAGGRGPLGFRLATDGRTLLPHKGERAVIATVRGLRRFSSTLPVIHLPAG
jgi:hypothetical protein